MRIIHVVALASPDGAYGGPLRVAVNQVRALRSLGHDAILVAGQAGFGSSVPDSIDGAPAQLFPVRRVPGAPGYGSLISAPMRRWLRGAAPAADILHVHLARDFLTAPAALIARSAGVPYVVQTHGMIRRPRHPAMRWFDSAITRRALEGARLVYVLDESEADELRGTGARATGIALLANGVELPPLPAAVDGPAVDERVGAEGLFLGRLHARKRPVAFAQAALAIAGRNPSARFAIVGPDEGERAGVEAAIRSAPREVAARVQYEGALSPEQTLARIARSDFFVLPSLDEPFGMSAVEAMSVGKPVIVTDSCGLASSVREYGAGLVVDSTPEALEGAMERLMQHASIRLESGADARRLVAERFSIEGVVERLVADYRGIVDASVGR